MTHREPPSPHGASLGTRALLGLASRRAGEIGAAVVCMGVSACATAGYAFLVGPVLRSFFGTDGTSPVSDVGPGSGLLASAADEIAAASVATVALLIIGAAGVKGVFFFLQRLFVVNAGQKILVHLRSSIYAGLLRSNHLSESVAPGELVTRFTVDAENVERSITEGVLAGLRDGLQVVALAALAIVLDPALGLVGLVAFPPAALLIFRFGRAIRKRRRKVYDAFGDLGAAVEETAEGLPVIRSFGAQAMLEDRFRSRNEHLARRTKRAILLRAATSPVNELLGAGALAATLAYAHHRISDGAISPEAFISFFTALVLLYQPVKGLSQAYHALQSGLAAQERLEPLLLLSKESDDLPVDAGSRASGASPRVRLDDVHAGYGKGRDVLRGVTLEVAPGEKVAVVGPSGSGKSTLVNVLLGHLERRSGDILLDEERADADSSHIRRVFAPVPQEPFLFDDDIAMNVRCARPDAGDEEIRGACKAAGVMNFADALEAGLGHRVGRRGSALSVGQRQRVCLARALLSDAPVLLLDEVTASFDGATERSVTENTARYMSGRSALVVTHRLSTAAWADRVVVLEDGVVRLEGALEDLMKRDRRLEEMFGTQQRKTNARS